MARDELCLDALSSQPHKGVAQSPGHRTSPRMCCFVRVTRAWSVHVGGQLWIPGPGALRGAFGPQCDWARFGARTRSDFVRRWFRHARCRYDRARCARGDAWHRAPPLLGADQWPLIYHHGPRACLLSLSKPHQTATAQPRLKYALARMSAGIEVSVVAARNRVSAFSALPLLCSIMPNCKRERPCIGFSTNASAKSFSAASLSPC